MIVTTAPVSKVVVDQESFTDITPVPCVSINWTGGGLEILFASDLTAAEALAVKARAESSYANEETLRNQGLQAMQANRADIATNEQWLANNPAAPAVTRALVEQSTRQARQINGVLRMLLGQLDGTD